jgi:ribosome biogenesis GTPase
VTKTVSSGLVLVSYGNRGVVELGDGRRVDCRWRRSVGRPVCGDRVQLAEDDGHCHVAVEIQPRENSFCRANARFEKQTIAANLDQVLVVIAAEPEPSRDLVERYLVAVHGLDMRPLLVLNKAELMAGLEPGDTSPLSRLQEYRELGYPVLETSCKGEPGTGALAPELKNRTSILVGQSGVGKSSLVNALLPDLELQTGELSRVTGKGTHTTTTTVLYTLPFGGRLIDSPGVWEYGLWRMDRDELVAGFPEFYPHASACRFNDCSHRGEPGCAVRAAMESGEIRSWRYQSYLRLFAQNEA